MEEKHNKTSIDSEKVDSQHELDAASDIIVFEEVNNERQELRESSKSPLGKVTCKTWIKTSPFTGMPKKSNFRHVNEEIVIHLKDGEILVQTLCWTVDNYLIVYDVPAGSVMIGEQVAIVVASKNSDFPVQTMLVCSKGWRTYSVLDPELDPVMTFPVLGELPVSLCLDILGYPGILAYYVLHEVCCVKRGEVVLVNAAAGALGNILGQIAKLKGCQVIAFCGSNHESSWLQSLGFDRVYNYRSVRPSSALGVVAPQGVDFYFDCVGAEFTMDVLSNIKPDGTTCVFGQVKSYDKTTLQGHRPDPYHLIVTKDGHVMSDSLSNHRDIIPQAQRQLLEWIHEGKIQYKHQVFSNFEMLPQALMTLYDRAVVGKLIITSSAMIPVFV